MRFTHCVILVLRHGKLVQRLTKSLGYRIKSGSTNRSGRAVKRNPLNLTVFGTSMRESGAVMVFRQSLSDIQK
jgi:lysophospholipid acyltransferase (LPLAT)-like uncharacterized protein